jgi:hypothetical protein
MTKKLARLLRADIQETSDLKSIAKTLANKGRGGDTILAHITPKEVKILKAAGGAGTINPDTGLMEFYDGDYYIPTEYSYGSDFADAVPDYSPPQNAPESSFYADYNAPAQQLTPPGIDPTEYAAGQQYADSAFPYYPATEGMDSDVYRFQAAAEFPPGMASRPDLLAAQAAGEAPALGVTPITQEARKAQTEQAAAAGGKAPPGLITRAGDVLSAIKAGGGDILDYLKKNPDLLRIGGAGAGAILGRQQAKKAAEQIQQATQEQKNLGQPYQQTGQELQRAAMSGELTPQGAQAYQAMRAQMAQGVESRGGVGVAQAQAQTEAFRQQLLANQYNLGLQVSQIGDNIALGAIRTGMQLDQQLNQANQQFYTQLAALAGGGTYGYNPQQVRG